MNGKQERDSLILKRLSGGQLLDWKEKCNCDEPEEYKFGLEPTAPMYPVGYCLVCGGKVNDDECL